MTLDEALRVAIEALRQPENNYPEMIGDREAFPLGQGNAAAAVLERLREELPRVESNVSSLMESIRFESGRFHELDELGHDCDPSDAMSSWYRTLSGVLVRLDPTSEERT